LMASAPTQGALIRNSAPLLFGAVLEGDRATRHFRGEVEAAALWARALTDPEVATLSALQDSPQPAPSQVDSAALFKIHWQNRVKAFREQNHALQNVVLLGDSITEGFDVAKYFPGRRILNRGIGADVIGNALPEEDPRGVLQRLDESVFNCAATDVFILIGINDLNSGRTIDAMEAGYRQLLDRLRQRQPALRIHVQSLLPTRGPHAQRNAPVISFNHRLQKLAGEFQCGWIDLHSLMRDPQGQLKEEFTQDGLHLTDPAYRLWREEVLKVLQWH
jgi:lysophospholipase L1-like esterase